MNAVPASLLRNLPRRKLTVAEVEAMVERGILHENERFELVAGEMIAMSPKGNWHEAVKVELLRHLILTLGPDCRVLPETTLRLSANTFLEPDVIVYPAAVSIPKLTADSLLLAIEIADSSLAYDLKTKPAIYAAFGVPELWVIDARKRLTTVHRAPGADGYADIRRFGPREAITATLLPELSLVVGDL
jgi:Uma2 family endonuclease